MSISTLNIWAFALLALRLSAEVHILTDRNFDEKVIFVPCSCVRAFSEIRRPTLERGHIVNEYAYR